MENVPRHGPFLAVDVAGGYPPGSQIVALLSLAELESRSRKWKSVFAANNTLAARFLLAPGDLAPTPLRSLKGFRQKTAALRQGLLVRRSYAQFGENFIRFDLMARVRHRINPFKLCWWNCRTSPEVPRDEFDRTWPICIGLKRACLGRYQRGRIDSMRLAMPDEL